MFLDILGLLSSSNRSLQNIGRARMQNETFPVRDGNNIALRDIINDSYDTGDSRFWSQIHSLKIQRFSHWTTAVP